MPTWYVSSLADKYVEKIKAKMVEGRVPFRTSKSNIVLLSLEYYLWYLENKDKDASFLEEATEKAVKEFSSEYSRGSGLKAKARGEDVEEGA